jgi:hypothetical protein
MDETNLGHVGNLALNHLDAVDDRTHTGAEGAAGAVVADMWDVGLGIERDGLVAGIIASHVALATVDAHLRINQRDNLAKPTSS